MSNLAPLNAKEQQDLIIIFQELLKLPNAENLRLFFYADTGGGLIDTSGKTVQDEKIILHWHDLCEGVEAMQAYARLGLTMEEA